jgi:hypothetical protein
MKLQLQRLSRCLGLAPLVCNHRDERHKRQVCVLTPTGTNNYNENDNNYNNKRYQQRQL